MASRKLRASAKSRKAASADIPQNVMLQGFTGVIPLQCYVLSLGCPINPETWYHVHGRKIVRAPSISEGGTRLTIATLDPSLAGVWVDAREIGGTGTNRRVPFDPKNWYIGDKETVAAVKAALDDVWQARIRLARLMAGVAQ